MTLQAHETDNVAKLMPKQSTKVKQCHTCHVGVGGRGRDKSLAFTTKGNDCFSNHTLCMLFIWWKITVDHKYKFHLLIGYKH